VHDWLENWLQTVEDREEHDGVQSPLLLVVVVTDDRLTSGNKDGGALLKRSSSLSAVKDATTGALDALAVLE